MNQRLYTVEEAAEILKVSRHYLYQMIKSGKLRVVKLGERQTRVSESVLEELINGTSTDVR